MGASTLCGRSVVEFSGRNGAPEEIRTPDPQIRSLVLYPAELRARMPLPGTRAAERRDSYRLRLPLARVTSLAARQSG